MLTCPLGAPYCFNHGAEYRIGRFSPQDFAQINRVGGVHRGTIQDNFALSWIGLPNVNTPYHITLENRASGGELRGSIVALTQNGLDIQPFPEVVGNNSSTTRRDYRVPPGTTHVLAVITNQGRTHTGANTCTLRDFTLKTEATGAPPPPPPACAVNPLAVTAGVHETSLSASIYGLTVISGVQAAGITSIEPYVSINQ
jgi:hypothetical protein